MALDKLQERKFLFPILALLVGFPILRHYGGIMMTGAPYTAIDSAFLILLIPLLSFPVIAILGQWYVGEDFWRERFKEGGMIALGAMAITLSLTVWLAIQFFTKRSGFPHSLPALGIGFRSMSFECRMAEVGRWKATPSESACGLTMSR